jgi:GT2 family glycosyltransferase
VARIGSFATDMGPRGHDLGGAEDLDWVLRALQLGARLRYVPEVLQYHYVDAARLTLPYLMEKAYKRTASTMALDPERHSAGVPPYLWRKLAGYAVRAVLSLNTARRRFYCVRTAAALGEVAGHREATRRGGRTARPKGA